MNPVNQPQTQDANIVRPHLENAEIRQEIIDAAHPERRKGPGKDFSTYRRLFRGANDWHKYKCERRVEQALQAPSVKLLIGALKSVGCDFNVSRHIACEYCDEHISGGYDADNQQIVICQNQATLKGDYFSGDDPFRILKPKITGIAGDQNDVLERKALSVCINRYCGVDSYARNVAYVRLLSLQYELSKRLSCCMLRNSCCCTDPLFVHKFLDVR